MRDKSIAHSCAGPLLQLLSIYGTAMFDESAPCRSDFSRDAFCRITAEHRD